MSSSLHRAAVPTQPDPAGPSEPLQPSRQSRPRVVFVDHCARLSGAELGLLRLLPEMAGAEVKVLLGEDGPLVGRLKAIGVSVEVLALNGRVRNLRRGRLQLGRFPPLAVPVTAAYALRLARRLRELKPDLVHAYSLKAMIYGSLAARLAGVPVVWHLHDRVASDYLPAGAVRLIRILGPRLSAAVIANSQATLASLALPASGAPAAHVLSYAVDPALFGLQGTGRDGVFTVGMVGRFAPWKGQRVFVDAFARAFPDGPERAVVVGAALFGEDAYEQEVRARVKELGLEGRIEFAGHRDDVKPEFDRMDALVHASVIPEPFGQVIVEGMAAGVSVIAARAGGPAEVIEDGVTGILYEPGNTEALAAQLRRVAQDPVLRQRMSAAARRRARDFMASHIAEMVVGVYRTVLDRSVPERADPGRDGVAVTSHQDV